MKEIKEKEKVTASTDSETDVFAVRFTTFNPKTYDEIKDAFYSYVFSTPDCRKIELFVYDDIVAVGENDFGHLVWHYKGKNTPEEYEKAIMIAKDMFLNGIK